ncbi:MAG: GMC family oxidoreductase [Elusimicrobiota bacterium]
MPDYDVCIIGSGAGGGIAAWALADAGLRVLVLEKGPFYTRKDLAHDEIRNRKYDFFVPYATDEPHLVKEDGAKGFRKSRALWGACCVGGGATHMAGFFYRMWPQDFKMRSTFGNPRGASVADWPITYDDLEPYYTRIEYLVGISGEGGQYPFEPRRSKPYPLPPLKAHPLAALVDKAAKGMRLHPFSTPRATLSIPYRDRPSCIYHADCGALGCPIGAKSGPLNSVLPEALRTGRCRIVPRAMAYRLETGSDGAVRRVVYYDSKGESRAVTARCFVAACGAIQTARLLLNSKSGRSPGGLGNGGGLVGRNLTFSTFVMVFASYKKETRDGIDIASKAPFLQRSLQDYYIVKDHEAHGLPYPKGGTFNFTMGYRAPVLRAERFLNRPDDEGALWGSGLKKRVLEELRDRVVVKLEVFQDFLPSPKTYVDVAEDVKDKWGIPVARARISHHPAEKPMSEFLAGKGKSILAKTDPRDLFALSRPGTTHHLQHGTCRFGKDPDRSVLDADCRAHEAGNLYAVDGSFMPTSGGVPATFTIMANSLRVSEKIVAAFKDGRL